ncbi:calcium/sodium antiporter [Vibrio sp. CAIM 722]|uniref:Calcium/sodium antiporter n=1 Tax=Vibrio eleionomae TaxID=2653505 RepID=A0A7X4RW82_9VIBR|nr:calcium/sodium antiporter [Vibrio eleionomae]MZI95661.1 calcium/sodium antiporter [Vibrio eleionomae]
MLLSILAIIFGFVLLVWSADKFVESASATAFHAGMPPLLIGMVIVGFGTSAPEMVVSAMAAMEGSPALALGNALGSNVVNISLVLGLAAMIAPLSVQSKIVKKELPLLLIISIVLGAMLWNSTLSQVEAWLLLGGFFCFVFWSIYRGMKGDARDLEPEAIDEIKSNTMSTKTAIIWLVVSLLILMGSSRLLVWGSVDIAHALGVSDLIIGLTVVALGTSLPELAATIIAAKKGEHDIALGNIIGSNMFNILAVIGIAGVIKPVENIGGEIFWRDWMTMLVVTIVLFAAAIGFKGKNGRITRWEGAILLLFYIGYNTYLISSVIQA